MSRRRARNREAGLRSSPFVVLADMTIGLAFFFAVFSSLSALANSTAIKVAKRQERQVSFRDDLVAAMAVEIAGLRAVEAGGLNLAGGGKSDKYTQLSTDGRRIGQIWENGNFQRISIDSVLFDRSRSADLTKRGQAVLKGMTKVLRKHRRDLAYLFVHGIAQPAEARESADQGLALSRFRADAVTKVFEASGLISAPEEPSQPDKLEKKYLIAYGTGTVLYTHPGDSVGRVDLVIFFEDRDD